MIIYFAAAILLLAACAIAFVANRTTRSLRRKLADAQNDVDRAWWAKQRANGRLQITVNALRRQAEYLERMRETGLWVAELESALRDLKKAIEGEPAVERPANVEGRV
jgi:hypothetical protein